MTQLRLSVEGLDNLEGQVPDVQKIKAGVLKAVEFLRSEAQSRTPVDTGALKGSWSEVAMTEGGYSFSNPLPYAGIIETGGYAREGPKTVMSGGAIYSKQAVGGILGPMIENEIILQKVTDIITKAIVEK
jgi:hypothetical protein